MQVHVLGKTTLGRPFLAVFISDSATLKHLDRYQMIQRKLMNPLLRGKGELESLLAAGKNIILITSAIHSTEPGGFTTPLVLTDRLARADTPEARAILANTIIILVPSQNPDGVDIVGDWYRSTLGTKAEGTSPPELYNHYVGHDDNRDWYAFTQPETRYTVDSLYTPWDPEIVNDIHQQGSNAGPDLHSAVHGSARSEHRPDPHRRHELDGDGDRLAHDRRREDRHRVQRGVRSVVAGAAVLAVPSRRANPHRDGERRRSRRRSTFRSPRSEPRAATRRRRSPGTSPRSGPAGIGPTATSSIIR